MSLTVEKCLQAWTNSLQQMKVKADIVFFGDSLTYYGVFSSLFQSRIVCNLGLRGDTIQGLIKRVEQVKLLSPQKVLLMAGINDVTYCRIDKFGQIYECLILELLSAVPKAELFVQSLLPVNDTDFAISCNNSQIIECNKEIAKTSNKHGLRIIDLFSVYAEKGVLPKNLTIDGIHFTESSL